MHNQKSSYFSDNWGTLLRTVQSWVLGQSHRLCRELYNIPWSFFSADESQISHFMGLCWVTEQLFQNHRCIHSHTPFGCSHRFKQLDTQKNRNRLLLLRKTKALSTLNAHYHLGFPIGGHSWSSDSSIGWAVVRMLCHLLTLNSIRRRCKQLVLTDCQFIFSSLEWPQQALSCSGKGSNEIPHW